jgi:hypothetical protein
MWFDSYRLVNSAAIEGLHGSLSRAGVIKLDKTVVVSFAIELMEVSRGSSHDEGNNKKTMQ